MEGRDRNILNIYCIYVYRNTAGEKPRVKGRFVCADSYSSLRLFCPGKQRRRKNLTVYSGISLESCNHVVKPLICNDITAALTVGESYCTIQETQQTEQAPNYCSTNGYVC